MSRTKFLIGYVMCLFNSFWLADDDDDDDEELKSTTKDTLTISIVVLVAIVVYILRIYIFIFMYIECSVTLPVENTKENSSPPSSSSSSSTTVAVYPSGHPEAVLIPRQKQIISKTYIFADIQNLWFWRKLCEAYIHTYICFSVVYWVSSYWDQSLNIVFADVRIKKLLRFLIGNTWSPYACLKHLQA